MKKSAEKLNILMIASSRRIGLTYHLTRLSIKLKKRGHNVTCIASSGEQDKGLQEMLKDHHIKLYRCNSIDKKNLYSIYNGARTIAKIIKLGDIDIVHTNGPAHLMQSCLARKLMLTNSKKPDIVLSLRYIAPGNKKLKYMLLSRLINMCADVVFPISEFVRLKLIKFGLKPSKAITVYGAIDFDKFYSNMPQEICPELKNINFGSSNSVAYIGDLHPLKGHKYYLEAAFQVLKIFPYTKFLIIGDGPLRIELQKMAAKLGIIRNVIFTGRIRNECIPQILKSVDIGVVSSLAETFCRALVEPMAAGKPVVTTPIGVAPEIIEDGVTGFIVPLKDSNALANAIIKLLENPEKAKQMGAKGAKLVREKFNLDKIVSQLEDVYRLVTRLKR